MGTARGEKTGAADAVAEQGEGGVREVLTLKLHQVSVSAAHLTVLAAVALSVFLYLSEICVIKLYWRSL